MTPHLLASAGGYQAFTLGGAERGWLVFALATGLVAISMAIYLVRGVIASNTGTDKMREIAAAIQEGAEAFLKRQFKTIAIIVVPLGVLVFFTATKVVEPNGHVALTFVQSGFARAIAFLCGATFSGLTGVIGMSMSVRGNVPNCGGSPGRAAGAGAQGRLPHRGHHGVAVRRPRPHRSDHDRVHLSEHGDRRPRRLRLRGFTHRPVHASRRRYLHQGGRRRRRPRRQGGGRHPRGRPSQCRHDRRQRR